LCIGSKHSLKKPFSVLIYFAYIYNMSKLLLSLFCICLSSAGFSQKNKSFSPGTKWLDDNGIPINAHGGNVLFHKNKYYWYGEHKLPDKSEAQMADAGIHCYSSKDLMNWKDEGIVLSVSFTDTTGDLTYGCILERPKVIYNKSSKLFMVYFKFYPKGTGYKKSYLGVATSKKPNGPFTYKNKSLGGASEFGSGDFVIYNDGKNVHHLAVRKPDKAFVGGILSKDLLSTTNSYKPLEGITKHTEAPAVVKVFNKYFLLGSGSSGWKPNKPRFYSADSLTGVFTPLENPCIGINPHNGFAADSSFGGQISFIIKVEGKENAYIAMFDIWKPDMPIEGMYIWLPILFKNGVPVIEWKDYWDLSTFK
jgi:hypothetical protein